MHPPIPTPEPDPRDIDHMDFSLYGTCSDEPTVQQLSVQGDEAGRQIIRDLMRQLDHWETTYRTAGASDTAARETMAINIARALGLKAYLD